MPWAYVPPMALIVHRAQSIAYPHEKALKFPRSKSISICRQCRKDRMTLISSWLVKGLSLLPAPLIKPFARPYVAGETLQELLTTVKTLNQAGYLTTVDLLGE